MRTCRGPAGGGGGGVAGGGPAEDFQKTAVLVGVHVGQGVVQEGQGGVFNVLRTIAVAFATFGRVRECNKLGQPPAPGQLGSCDG